MPVSQLRSHSRAHTLNFNGLPGRPPSCRNCQGLALLPHVRIAVTRGRPVFVSFIGKLFCEHTASGCQHASSLLCLTSL